MNLPPPPPPPPTGGPSLPGAAAQAPWQPHVAMGAGQHWPTAPAAPPPPRPSGFTPLAVIALIGAAALTLGSFLPWVQVTSAFGTLSVNGFDGGDGKLTAIAGAIALVLFLVGASARAYGCHIAAVIVCGLGGLVAIYDVVNVSNKAREEDFGGFARAGVGFGLWLCALGAVVGVGCGIGAAVAGARRSSAAASMTAARW